MWTFSVGKLRTYLAIPSIGYIYFFKLKNKFPAFSYVSYLPRQWDKNYLTTLNLFYREDNDQNARIISEVTHWYIFWKYLYLHLWMVKSYIYLTGISCLSWYFECFCGKWSSEYWYLGKLSTTLINTFSV